MTTKIPTAVIRIGDVPFAGVGFARMAWLKAARKTGVLPDNAISGVARGHCATCIEYYRIIDMASLWQLTPAYRVWL